MPNLSFPPFLRRRVDLVLLVATLLYPVTQPCSVDAAPSSARRTAVVRAVEGARPSVVNIHGHKTLGPETDQSGGSEGPRRVNGMGTGVIVDPRGYVVTNHHVVDGVSRIHVTMATGKTHIAKLISHDEHTDLAVIKINAGSRLPVIKLGTSSDLMAGEPVVAVGNAYGYEHTVTRGVISALNRTVQISDSQTYEDLIQTDASINPGNSGGPLLNVDGEMIGINVAVRTGAQGIGFAIPVNMVLDVTADLLSIARLENKWHGVVPKKITDGATDLIVAEIEANSPAARGGILPGDRITAVDSHRVTRALDFEQALLGRDSEGDVEVTVERSSRVMPMRLALTSLPRVRRKNVSDRAWQQLGLKLAPISSQKMSNKLGRYRGGLAVVSVRPGSPAESQGIRRGDILVGMHIWETVTLDNVTYVLNHPDLVDIEPLKFYILRGDQTFFGYLAMANRARR